MEIEREQLKDIYSNATLGLLGHTAMVAFMFYFLMDVVPVIELTYWGLGMLIILLLRAFNIYQYIHQKQSVNTRINIKRWLWPFQAGVLATGTLWGLTAFFADFYVASDYYFILMAIGLGLAGAALSVIGSVFSVYLLFTTPMLSIIAITMILTFEKVHIEFGLALFFGLGFMLNSAYRHSQNFRENCLKTLEVERTQLDIIERLGTAGECRDNDTGLHIQRMSHSSYLLAKRAGCDEEHAKLILAASPMHDIGKIGIPDRILLKPGKLNDEEFEIMKTHAAMGKDILDNHDSKLMQLAAEIAGCHHEKWDGSGYPNGLSGKNIPLEARIVCICDVFDALTSERPYKKAWSMNDAFNYIQQQSEKHFDPELVPLFLEMGPEIIEYSTQNQDDETDWSFWVEPKSYQHLIK